MNVEQAKIVAYMQKRDHVTQSELAEFLDVTVRHVREIIESINNMFIDGKFNYMIIGDYAGCKLTDDVALISKYNSKRLATAQALTDNAMTCQRRIGELV